MAEGRKPAAARLRLAWRRQGHRIIVLLLLLLVVVWRRSLRDRGGLNEEPETLARAARDVLGSSVVGVVVRHVTSTIKRQLSIVGSTLNVVVSTSDEGEAVPGCRTVTFAKPREPSLRKERARWRYEALILNAAVAALPNETKVVLFVEKNFKAASLLRLVALSRPPVWGRVR